MKSSNRVIITSLATTGIVSLVMGLVYLFQTIFMNLWDDTVFRTFKIIVFLGGFILLGIARIIKNQDIIISKLNKNIEE